MAQAHLARGNGDATAEYLLATLNHGTPLYTWCEERGQEPGTNKISGDRQHLYTPVALLGLVRDALENDRLEEFGRRGLEFARTEELYGMVEAAVQTIEKIASAQTGG